jgi:trans-aconitate methyltransferase
MDHADHVSLLEGLPGVREALGAPIRGAAGKWADLGAGGGAFTLALADLLSPEAEIYAVDRDAGALTQLTAAMRNSLPAVQLHTLRADFTQAMPLPTLDGIVMANALHFLPDRQKRTLLIRLRGCLRPGGQLILVEYGTDQGNRWVPHPLSYSVWANMAADAGYTKTTRLNLRPSRFLGSIYAAVSLAP